MSKTPPKGLGPAGRTLWRAILADYELEQHEERLLLELARTADALDALDAVVLREGVLDPETGKAHPALVEARQQRIAYARLAAALRVPMGDQADDPKAGRRQQRRVGARGVYAIRGGAA